MSPADTRAALAHYADVAKPTQDELDAEFNAELVARVQREAEEATRLPWWFGEAAVAVVILTLLISVLWPMGLAS